MYVFYLVIFVNYLQIKLQCRECYIKIKTVLAIMSKQSGVHSAQTAQVLQFTLTAKVHFTGIMEDHFRKILKESSN